MSTRAWLALVGLAAVLGGIGGWSLRVSTVSDRYIRSLAEYHEANKRFWDTKTAEILTNNTLDIERRKKQ